MATNCGYPAASRAKGPRLEPVRQALARAIGDVQFPQVLIEIDGLTRFSWILLGRPPRSEQELVTLYAGLIGLGSDLSAAELVRMVTPLAADSLGQMVLRIELADGCAGRMTRCCASCASIASRPSGDAGCSPRPT